ncbi:hypothetical protein GQ53DRAFT_646475 [Thozetella sp. PMI_491]|nr:hypothetical protein GQ53DRAFT_646475 [Thozetella sp. PMI_491]
MGWFWQSSPDASKAAAPSSALPTQPVAPAAPSKPDNADRELAKFWEMLQDEVNPGAKKQPPPAPAQPTPIAPKPTASSWFSWGSSPSPSPPAAATAAASAPTTAGPQARPRERSAASLAMSEESIPTTMSCRDAFDYAWHCHTAGAQWNAVYRYGGVRSCTELWDDFWFCMRTRSFAPELRAAAIKEHYRAKEAAKYGGGQPSSEDVWESRDKLVAPGSVFNHKFDMPDTDDAQFQRDELRRRREVRKGLGYDDKN